MQDEVRREDEGRQVAGVVAATDTFGAKVMRLMAPSKRLRSCQLQLAGNGLVLGHEEVFTPEVALADPCDAPRSTQTGAETMFVEIFAVWRFGIVVLLGQRFWRVRCDGLLFVDDERLDRDIGDKHAIEVGDLGRLCWACHLYHRAPAWLLSASWALNWASRGRLGLVDP